MVSVHVEADAHLHRTLMSIKAAGGEAGVAINPATPIVALEEALDFADYVLVMSVNPGVLAANNLFLHRSDKVRRSAANDR